MPKRLIPPPLGLPKRPDLALASEREAELLAEFKKRLSYVQASYRYGLRAETRSFNESLARLKRAVRHGPELPGRGDPLHPFLQVAVNLHARRYASERTGCEGEPITADDVAQAAAHLAVTAKPIRGRPRARLLDHHVAGLMALIQETCGTAVTAIRETSAGGYAPRLVGVGQVVLFVLGDIDPTITETQLANKVLELRRTYAGKSMRFRDFFPLYGAKIDGEGNPECASPYWLNSFWRCHPIYCR